MGRTLSTLISACALLAYWHAAGVQAADGKIITYYKDPYYHLSPRTGWTYLWNAKGKIGESKNYMARVRFGRNLAASDKAGKQIMPMEGRVRAEENGIPRYAIKAYTVQRDHVGDVWLINGNLKTIRKGSGVVLRVYVDDTLKYSANVPKQPKAHLFQCRLGQLKKGATIYVAVGPRSEGENHYHTRYTIALFMPGQKPGAPINILSPGATEATPKRDELGREDAGYVRWHQSGCTKALKQNARLVLLGDSITWAWSMRTMNEKLGKYRPANLGISGDWTQNVLWRVENGVFDDVKPKAVVLMIGTNNVSAGYTVDEIVAGIDAILKALRKKTPESTIILHGIFPRGKSIHNNPAYDKIKKINDKISTFGDGKRVLYMNINDKLIEKDGSISKENFPDLLHPSKKGILIWGDAIIPTLDKLGVDRP